MWSNERKSLIHGNEFSMYVRGQFTTPALGTRPKDPNTLIEYLDQPADKVTVEASLIENDKDSEIYNGKTPITVFPYAKFFKAGDQYFDFFDVEVQRLNHALNRYMTHDGHIMTNYLVSHSISVIIDNNGEIIPYYINPTNPADRSNQVEGEWVTLPFIWGYQWQGAAKEVVGQLQRVDAVKVAKKKAKAAATKESSEETDETGKDIIPKRRGRPKKTEATNVNDTQTSIDNLYEDFILGTGKAYACAKMTQYKKKIDSGWMFSDRTPLIVPDKYVSETGELMDSYRIDPKTGERRLQMYARSLRCETMQGPRTAIAVSEMVPPGTEFYFKVTLLDPNDKAALFEVLDMKGDIGMLQWRSGGKGRLRWTPADKNSNPIDIDVTKFV